MKFKADFDRHCLGAKKGRGCLKRRFRRTWQWAIAVILLVILLQVRAIATPHFFAQHPPTESQLPQPQAHPLPATLANWQDPSQSGDYFTEVEPSKLGYLIWSEFPIKIYLEAPKDASPRAQAWFNSVEQAIQDWYPYLPLTFVEQPENADIRFWYQRPPLRLSANGEIGRARAAEARYEFYRRLPATLAHRCDIYLSPHQTAEYTLATARHELGHALGIWGHSPLETDVMYFSQVRDPAPISPRDINTLKRIYEQPTLLGWTFNS